jgi:two-component system, OmpR family, response regulator
MAVRVLVVEDDRAMADNVRRILSDGGHAVETASDGIEAADKVRAGDHDVLVVDRMMPRKDGIAFVSELRAEGVQTPVLFLSALGEVDHRVEGLRAGGDDYLVKPPAPAELLARVEALARRRDVAASAVTKLTVGDLEMDLLGRTVVRSGRRLDLQPREFALLEFMMRNAGKVVTRTMLLENVWDYHFDPQTNVIDVHVSRLRGKVDKDFPTQMLHTVRGAGYRLEA